MLHVGDPAMVRNQSHARDRAHNWLDEPFGAVLRVCDGGRESSIMPEDPTLLMQKLHDEHAAALWGFCLHLTADPVRAEDIAQETLLRAWQHPEVLDPTRGSAGELPEPRDTADETDTLLQSWAMAEAISHLSREHRAVLVECYYRGRSVAEAARQLGVPEGTVKSRSHYALRALRLAVEEMGLGS